jgi:hypothetical protein
MRISAKIGTAAMCAAALLLTAAEARAFVFITEQEAALPNATGARQPDMRGITRGPKILVLSPALDAGVVRSPLNLLLKFETYGGADTITSSPRSAGRAWQVVLKSFRCAST